MFSLSASRSARWLRVIIKADAAAAIASRVFVSLAGGTLKALGREPSGAGVISQSSRTWSMTRPKTLLIRNIPNFDAGSPVFGNLGRTRASRCPLLGQGGATGSGGRSTGYDGSPAALV